MLFGGSVASMCAVSNLVIKTLLISLLLTATVVAEVPSYQLDQGFGFRGAFGFQGVNYRGNIRIIATDGESKIIAIGNMGAWNATDVNVFLLDWI